MFFGDEGEEFIQGAGEIGCNNRRENGSGFIIHYNGVDSSIKTVKIMNIMLDVAYVLVPKIF